MRSFPGLAAFSLVLLATFALAAPKSVQPNSISNPKKPPDEAWSYAPVGCTFKDYHCLVVDKLGYRGWKNLWGTTSKETEDVQDLTVWFNVSYQPQP